MSRNCKIQGPRISVFLAEANLVTCQLMAQALSRPRNRISVVGFACESKDVLKFLTNSQMDVAVISVNLKDGSLMGFKVVRELRAVRPNVRAIILVDSPTPEMIVSAFRSGAQGLFRRNTSLTALCKCIRTVYEGQIWASSEELHCLLEALTEATPMHIVNSQGTDLLSCREETLVRLVADGLTNREIASHLNLSEHTVRNYLVRVFNKLGISSRVELTLYAVSHRQSTQHEIELSAKA